MAHLVSIIFFFSLLVGLAMLLERILRDNGAAIRNALFGTGIGVTSNDGALGRIGACLRASFPSLGEKALDPALAGLLLQLCDSTPSRAGRA